MLLRSKVVSLNETVAQRYQTYIPAEITFQTDQPDVSTNQANTVPGPPEIRWSSRNHRQT